MNFLVDQELESPFGNVPNDVPLLTYQAGVPLLTYQAQFNEAGNVSCNHHAFHF